MSMELHVFLRDSSVPTVGEWQQAIREAGFDLLLDNGLRLREDTGFSPAVYRGRKARAVGIPSTQDAHADLC